jgi:hypothetical protein
VPSTAIIREYAKEQPVTIPNIMKRPTPWKFVRPDQGNDYFERTLPDGIVIRFDIQSGRKVTVKS